MWLLAVLAIALVALVVAYVPGPARVAHDAFGISLTVAPHSTSGRSVGYALRVFVNNTLLTLWPLAGLYLLRDVPASWWRAWHVLVVLVAARNVAPVSAALGIWGVRVLPYIPNAPFELAAFITAPVLLVLYRRGQITETALLRCGLAIPALTAIAAALETWAVPLH